jgi:hypothetical protein
MQRIKETV